jgi:hypothetical protein
MYLIVRQGTGEILRVAYSLTVSPRHPSDDARSALRRWQLATQENANSHLVKANVPQIWLSIGCRHATANSYSLAEIGFGVSADLQHGCNTGMVRCGDQKEQRDHSEACHIRYFA